MSQRKHVLLFHTLPMCRFPMACRKKLVSDQNSSEKFYITKWFIRRWDGEVRSSVEFSTLNPLLLSIITIQDNVVTKDKWMNEWPGPNIQTASDIMIYGRIIVFGWWKYWQQPLYFSYGMINYKDANLSSCPIDHLGKYEERKKGHVSSKHCLFM